MRQTPETLFNAPLVIIMTPNGIGFNFNLKNVSNVFAGKKRRQRMAKLSQLGQKKMSRSAMNKMTKASLSTIFDV